MELRSFHSGPNKFCMNGMISSQLLSPSKFLSASRICSLVRRSGPAEADHIASTKTRSRLSALRARVS
eukprot:9449196-Prorocentrum_lima.AAC.1